MARKSRWWGDTRNNISIGTGVQVNQDLTFDIVTELGVSELRGNTVAAIYGSYSLLSTVDDGSALIHGTDMGIGVFPENAGAGIPRPGVDSFQWMWFRSLHHRPVVREHAAGVFRFELSIPSTPFEVHSMRKLSMNERLFLVLFNQGPQTVVIQADAHILFLK